jgi:hypothetical protein
VPLENIFFLALVVFAFAAFGLALAYGAAVAGGPTRKTEAAPASPKTTRA